MKYGLIGKPLGHSWSPEIHNYFIHEDYEKLELDENEVEKFINSYKYQGLNVTIPYKKKVMEYLDWIDETAEEIGAVNCIVRNDFVAIGYNTDYLGFIDMVNGNGWKLKNVAILGSGGASKAIYKAVETLGGDPVIVSRSPIDNQISYEELYANQSTFTHIINTTPVGMYPYIEQCPVDIDKFEKLEGIIDIIANPLETKLQFLAKMKNIPVLGGYEMLVRQAAKADELFTDKPINEKTIQGCIRHIKNMHQNIVLIGMPTSGKTTIAKILAEKLNINVVDMDTKLVEKFGKEIDRVFQEEGEQYFRKEENLLIKQLLSCQNTIISTGGGVVKNEENMQYLRANSIVIWLDRDPKYLFATSTRPLSSSKEALCKLYQERKALYQKYCHYRVENNGTIDDVIQQIQQLIEGKNI